MHVYHGGKPGAFCLGRQDVGPAGVVASATQVTKALSEVCVHVTRREGVPMV